MMGARISIVNFMHITCDCYISDLELSEDDKYAAAYTNNYQIIILNTLISEFIIVENPFKHPQIPGDTQSVEIHDESCLFQIRRVALSWA